MIGIELDNLEEEYLKVRPWIRRRWGGLNEANFTDRIIARLPEGEREGALARKNKDLVVRVDGKAVFQKKTNGGVNAQEMMRQLEA